MARSRKRVSRGTRRVKKDWVYRPNEIAETPTNFGGYGGARSVSDGPGNAASFILYDSQDYIKYITESGVTNAGFPPMPNAARAEGKLPTCYAVEGWLGIRKTAWTLQDLYRAGWRLGWFEQDLTSGLLSLQAEYTMWDMGGFYLDHAPAMFANAHPGHFKEWRVVDYSIASSNNYF